MCLSAFVYVCAYGCVSCLFSPVLVFTSNNKDWVQQEAHDVKDFFPTLRIVGRSAWAMQRNSLIAAVTFSLLAAFLQASAQERMSRIVDSLVHMASLSPALAAGELEEDSLDVLWASSLGWVLCTSLQVACQRIGGRTIFYVATQVEDSWRACAIRRFFELPVAWHTAHDTGEITQRIGDGWVIWSILYTIFGEATLKHGAVMLGVLCVVSKACPGLLWVNDLFSRANLLEWELD
jgi:hypothetical protein